ncbi:hypothetical protein QFZ82_001930 [Streptomyces sp. V4I23]|uniref:hypothetical protein n=1 Tax=Streptomyces sp. V4I23 TaxID=3042282 RepID=UPI00277D79F2|nr:hypothetical protein [Streptomyces sp. V4I23]MDQ1007445.1 hypothetical protein [Streptomyces sp. V4I23]
MSGDSYFFGDNVNMHGGSGNTGIVKNQGAAAAAPPVSPAVQAAVEELLRLVEELRDKLPPASAQVLDDSLPDVTADATAQPQIRNRALLAIAGIAATVGAIGQPVLDAANSLMELLGAK